jgi:threonine dehydratase
VTYDRSRESREEIGAAIAKETGAAIVPPYDHPWTITGQGTAVMELMEDVPDLDAVLVCLGGGGLLAGSAIAARSMKPSSHVFGVEPEVANDWALSLAANERIEIAQPPTIADGLRTQKPGAVTFPIVQRLAAGALLVSEDEIQETIRFLLTRMKLVVEPSGAVAAAAALHKKLPKGLQRVGITITGGNIDMEMLSSICGSPKQSFVD